MEVIKTDCGLCINCCGVNAYVEDGKLVKVEGIPEHWLNKGRLCPKGERLPDLLYSPSRLKYPMKKVNGRFQRISWDGALGEIGAKLMELKEKYGAHTLATWTGSVGVEHFEMAAFNQRFRGAYGTPNFFNPEGICFRTRILARQITFGRYPVEEPTKASCILLWGRNPDESYWPVGRQVRERVQAGAKLITIDPRRIPISTLGIYLQPRPGTDGAIALAMINVIIEEDLWDKEFVAKYTTGFDKLTEHVKEFTPEKAELYSARMEKLGFPGLPEHVEPQQSSVANPEIAKQYPEVLLTGCRTIEYIDAQMRDVPALRARRPNAEAEIHPATAAKYGVVHGELIAVESPRGSIKIKANVTPDIKQGVVSVPHGWADANCNLLLDAKLLDHVSGYITMNSVACRIVKLV